MKKGLTLVEVLIVVLILGVLAMVAIPRQGDHVDTTYKMNLDLIAHRMINSAALISLHEGKGSLELNGVSYSYNHASNEWEAPTISGGSNATCEEIFLSLSHEADTVISGHSISTPQGDGTSCTFTAEDPSDFTVTYTFADSSISKTGGSVTTTPSYQFSDYEDAPGVFRISGFRLTYVATAPAAYPDSFTPDQFMKIVLFIKEGAESDVWVHGTGIVSTTVDDDMLVGPQSALYFYTSSASNEITDDHLLQLALAIKERETRGYTFSEVVLFRSDNITKEGYKSLIENISSPIIYAKGYSLSQTDQAELTVLAEANGINLYFS